MENDVNSYEMLCDKISKNPQKVFFTIAGSGDKQNQKTNIFSNSASLDQAFFCPLSWNFTTTLRSGDSCFWATLMYLYRYQIKTKLPVRNS